MKDNTTKTFFPKITTTVIDDKYYENNYVNLFSGFFGNVFDCEKPQDIEFPKSAEEYEESLGRIE